MKRYIKADRTTDQFYEHSFFDPDSEDHISDPDPVRRERAAEWSTDPELLDVYAHDPDFWVRESVARNKHTSIATLTEMLEDNVLPVVLSVLQNKNLPKDVTDQFLSRNTLCNWLDASFSYNPDKVYVDFDELKNTLVKTITDDGYSVYNIQISGTQYFDIFNVNIVFTYIQNEDTLDEFINYIIDTVCANVSCDMDNYEWNEAFVRSVI